MLPIKSSLVLLLAVLSSTSGFASNLCIATNGGFGHEGTTFVGTGYALPAGGKCTPWTGFTKTASSVVLTTYGTGCLSSNGKAFTVSVTSSDPDFFGTVPGLDYIVLTRSGSTGSFSSGSDGGAFGGSADEVTCTSSLLELPSSHD